MPIMLYHYITLLLHAVLGRLPSILSHDMKVFAELIKFVFLGSTYVEVHGLNLFDFFLHLMVV